MIRVVAFAKIEVQNVVKEKCNKKQRNGHSDAIATEHAVDKHLLLVLFCLAEVLATLLASESCCLDRLCFYDTSCRWMDLHFVLLQYAYMQYGMVTYGYTDGVFLDSKTGRTVDFETGIESKRVATTAISQSR